MQTFLVPRDAGKILGVTSARVIQFDRDGRLKAIRDSAGRRLFREVDVLKFAEKRRKKTEAKSKVQL